MAARFFGGSFRLATGDHAWAITPSWTALEAALSSAFRITLDDEAKTRAMQETAWADVSQYISFAWL